MLSGFPEDGKGSSAANRLALKSQELPCGENCEISQLCEIRNDLFATTLLGIQTSCGPEAILIFSGEGANAGTRRSDLCSRVSSRLPVS
jgi:hypothetical protein